MKYSKITSGTFVERPNRFVAYVKIPDQEEVERVHVKNTGRCRELFIPGASVILARAENSARKTKYDLVAVYKEGFGWINIDSQAPNHVVREWLEKKKEEEGYTCIRPETSYGNSRFDFYLERGEERIYMEVKGCTLEEEGRGYFPDAPTIRGTKHIQELIEAKKNGFRSILAFVIQMEGIHRVYPNTTMDVAFSNAFYEAKEAGVEIWYLPCKVTEDSLEIDEKARPKRLRFGNGDAGLCPCGCGGSLV